MCFSVQVDKDLKKLAKRFNATPSAQSFAALNALQKLENDKGADYLKAELGLKRKPSAKVFKESDEKGRIYPGYWANVIVHNPKGQKEIRPMRYRVRPQGSLEEIPSKYNVFNSRIDSLEKRQTWKNIFMRNHAIFPFTHFFEWVEVNGKKKLINFAPKNRELMWAPAIYDNWTSPSGEIQFESFAIITDSPPKEIEDVGHDRCPIFMNEKMIDTWLSVKQLSLKTAYQVLSEKENVYFKTGGLER